MSAAMQLLMAHAPDEAYTTCATLFAALGFLPLAAVRAQLGLRGLLLCMGFTFSVGCAAAASVFLCLAAVDACASCDIVLPQRVRTSVEIICADISSRCAADAHRRVCLGRWSALVTGAADQVDVADCHSRTLHVARLPQACARPYHDPLPVAAACRSLCR